MATVVKKADGRYEIRESVVTQDGPRSRTLAVFRELTPATLAAASARALRPFDAERVMRRAADLGAPVIVNEASRLGRQLLGRLQQGEQPGPVVARLLRDGLGGESAQEAPATVEAMMEWLGASDEERGRAVRDVVRFADVIVRSRGLQPRQGPLSYPRLPSTP